MTVAVELDELRAALTGMTLPGGSVAIDRHESAIADHAVRSARSSSTIAHPIWFVIASLRGMGVTVDDLCELARKTEEDTLLFGGVTLEQSRPLEVDREYETRATITAVDRTSTRSGAVLDSVTVEVRVSRDGIDHGAVTSVYLFKRGVPA